MMTVAEVKIIDSDVSDISVDIDDNDFAYIKQQFWPDRDRQEWICLPVHKVPELIAALQEVHT